MSISNDGFRPTSESGFNGTAGEAEPTGDERSPEPGEGRGEPGLFRQVMDRFRPRAQRMAREDLTEALSRGGAGEDAFSPTERIMLANILALRDLRVEDVMINRADIEAVELTATLGELLEQFESNGHSRMPVYGESLDDPRGMIHIRDVMAHVTRAARAAAAASAEDDGPGAGLALGRIDLSQLVGSLSLVREVLFVPPSMPASVLMARMQATRTQMALVIDEYGGTDGLVSLEDVIELVVGDIADEHDDETPLVVETAEDVFTADARAELSEVRRAVGEDFDASAYVDEADTIGGLLFSQLGRVPARGEVVKAVPGFELRVLEADPRRVRRVQITRLRASETLGRLRRVLVGNS